MSGREDQPATYAVALAARTGAGIWCDIRSDIITDMNDAAETIRELRKRHGISQRQLALRAGTSQAAISQLESGRRDLSVGTLERILLALGYRLNVVAEPLPLDVDERHFQADLAAPMADRLERALAWDRFGDELGGAAAAAERAGAARR
jgi:transcriptional regulator with XRE-family HTH domain